MEYSRKSDTDQQQKQPRNSASGSSYDKIDSPIVSKMQKYYK